MTKITHLRHGGKSTNYSNDLTVLSESPNRSRICPACYISVAPAAKDAEIFNDQYYHGHCLTKHDPKDSRYEDVYEPLFRYHAELEQIAEKSAEEEMTFNKLHPILFRNGVCKKIKNF